MCDVWVKMSGCVSLFHSVSLHPNVCSPCTQVDKRKQDEKARRDDSNERYLQLVEQERLYYKTVRDFQDVRTLKYRVVVVVKECLKMTSTMPWFVAEKLNLILDPALFQSYGSHGSDCQYLVCMPH